MATDAARRHDSWITIKAGATAPTTPPAARRSSHRAASATSGARSPRSPAAAAEPRARVHLAGLPPVHRARGPRRRRPALGARPRRRRSADPGQGQVGGDQGAAPAPDRAHPGRRRRRPRRGPDRRADPRVDRRAPGAGARASRWSWSPANSTACGGSACCRARRHDRRHRVLPADLQRPAARHPPEGRTAAEWPTSSATHVDRDPSPQAAAEAAQQAAIAESIRIDLGRERDGPAQPAGLQQVARRMEGRTRQAADQELSSATGHTMASPRPSTMLTGTRQA